jgi:hypothetical protein
MTVMWFIQGDTFSEWKASGVGSVLWVHGKRQFEAQPSAFTVANTYPFCSGCRQECPLVR